MDKAVDVIAAILAFTGGVLVASGLFVQLPLIAHLGIPLGRQAFVGGILLLIALAVYVAMGGRLSPRQR